MRSRSFPTCSSFNRNSNTEYCTPLAEILESVGKLRPPPVVRNVVRRILVIVESGNLTQLRGAHRLTTQPVDRTVARGRGQPGTGPVRYAVDRPPLECRGERLLRALLGQLPVTGHPDQSGDHLAPLLPVDVLQRHTGGSSTGRISIVP